MTAAGLRSLAKHRLPAGSLVGVGAVSIQLGAATAAHLFARVGPAGAVTLRLVLASCALVVVIRPRPSGLRHLRGRWGDMVVAAGLGLVLASMNLAFYEAISRIPLGVAVTVEFAGPLAVTIGASRRRSDLLWALLAGCGVFLLAGGSLFGRYRLDLLGVGLALVAGGCWAGYIILSAQTARRFSGSSGLALAMVVAAVAILPLGISAAGARLLDPGTLGLGAVVAILSSVLPYSLDMVALRRISPRAFGILLSMDPGVAALAGFAVLGQSLSATEATALVLVVAANAGSSWFDSRRQEGPLLEPAAGPITSRADTGTCRCCGTILEPPDVGNEAVAHNHNLPALDAGGRTRAGTAPAIGEIEDA